MVPCVVHCVYTAFVASAKKSLTQAQNHLKGGVLAVFDGVANEPCKAAPVPSAAATVTPNAVTGGVENR